MSYNVVTADDRVLEIIQHLYQRLMTEAIATICCALKSVCWSLRDDRTSKPTPPG